MGTIKLLQWIEGAGPDALTMFLTVAIITCVPTSSECIVLAQMGGSFSANRMASCICAQYLAAPLLLTSSLVGLTYYAYALSGYDDR